MMPENRREMARPLVLEATPRHGYSWTIPGPPVGKGRPRLSTRGGFARAYTPPKTAHWEGFAFSVLRQGWGDHPPIDAPCRLRVVAVGERPKSLQRKKDPPGRMVRTTKPDGDNVLKCVGDALKLAGVVRDDVLIWSWHCESMYAAKGEGPCVEVTLEVTA